MKYLESFKIFEELTGQYKKLIGANKPKVDLIIGQEVKD